MDDVFEIVPGLKVIERHTKHGVSHHLESSRKTLPSGDIEAPWDCAMDGMESLLLALVCEMPEILLKPELKMAVETAIDAISNEHGE